MNITSIMTDLERCIPDSCA